MITSVTMIMTNCNNDDDTTTTNNNNNNNDSNNDNTNTNDNNSNNDNDIMIIAMILTLHGNDNEHTNSKNINNDSLPRTSPKSIEFLFVMVDQVLPTKDEIEALISVLDNEISTLSLNTYTNTEIDSTFI